ncbi:MAG TPA: ATP-binding protein [Arachidicoccus sp.]|nr:ATP-binding protein [Arachidicoccus sp.]
MKIRLKLILSVGSLFLLIILLTVISTLYINALKSDTKNILTDNYNTLEYSKNMMLALDAVGTDREAYNQFELNLNKQRQNVTEPGEQQATKRVSAHFQLTMLHPLDSTLKPLIRQDIAELMRLNMDAIEKKSEIAAHTAEIANVWIAFAGTICFLFAFILLVNLPGNIANPISELTESIKQIAARNYSRRVNFESNSEFGALAKSFNTMAEKLEEYAGSTVAELLIEKKRIEALIGNMSDPVLGLDENQKILFANDEALKITGLKRTAVVGLSVVQVAKSNDLMRILYQALGKTKENGNLAGSGSGGEQTLRIYADNKESYFEKEVVSISILPTGETVRKDIGHVIILKNVTPFKELELAKTSFIATVSHELKTPIASIQMSIQLLKHQSTGGLNEEQEKLVDGIGEESARLLKITGELLNITQVETGNIQLNIQKSDMSAILQYAVDATRIQAEQKDIRFVIGKDAVLPKIDLDPEKTAWVLTNFITNAIRYSSENSVINLSVRKKDAEICFAVQDFGGGIEEQYRERVFERYFQVPGSSKLGTGLGLAICKEFIEAQGGKIGVKSETGLGSTFYFLFPC